MIEQTRVAAYGIIVKETKLLLCRFSPSLPNYVGQWTLPGGGLDFGESPEDGMVREVFEETGLKVGVGTLLSVDSKLTLFDDKQLHSIRILYQARYLGGELHYEQNGTTDKCDWFTQQQAKELPLADIAQNLRAVSNYLNSAR